MYSRERVDKRKRDAKDAKYNLDHTTPLVNVEAVLASRLSVNIGYATLLCVQQTQHWLTSVAI